MPTNDVHCQFQHQIVSQTITCRIASKLSISVPIPEGQSKRVLPFKEEEEGEEEEGTHNDSRTNKRKKKANGGHINFCVTFSQTSLQWESGKASISSSQTPRIRDTRESSGHLPSHYEEGKTVCYLHYAPEVKISLSLAGPHTALLKCYVMQTDTGYIYRDTGWDP